MDPIECRRVTLICASGLSFPTSSGLVDAAGAGMASILLGGAGPHRWWSGVAESSHLKTPGYSSPTQVEGREAKQQTPSPIKSPSFSRNTVFTALSPGRLYSVALDQYGCHRQQASNLNGERELCVTTAGTRGTRTSGRIPTTKPIEPARSKRKCSRAER